MDMINICSRQPIEGLTQLFAIEGLTQLFESSTC